MTTSAARSLPSATRPGVPELADSIDRRVARIDVDDHDRDPQHRDREERR